MKFALCFLAVVSCAAALPAEVPFEAPEEFDLSELVPKDIYAEPIVPVDTIALPGSRIIGGQEVAPNSVPYQVAVIINGAGLCGGSLISTSRALTAAHCTIDASFVQVRLGAHNFNTNEATQVRITSTSIINHASYNVDSWASNDIAVILLPSAVTLNANIQVIPLATASAGTYDGSSAFLTGWGRTTDASNAISQVLRGVTVSVMGNAVCRSIYGDIVLDSNVCTSGAGIVGGCNGDSGGPLVVNGVQIGIVSFGSARCEAGNPSVFARISSFRTWITQNGGV